MAPPVVGATAPAFALENQDGALVRLEHFGGRKVLIWFFSRAFGSN